MTGGSGSGQIMTDQDPGCTRTYGSYWSGSTTLGSGSRSRSTALGSGSRSRSTVLMAKIWKKLQLKNLIFFFFENCNSRIPKPLWPPKRTSSTSKHEISHFFLFLLVIFALLDPDPDPAEQNHADPCGSGFETLIKYRVSESETNRLISFFVWFLFLSRKTGTPTCKKRQMITCMCRLPLWVSVFCRRRSTPSPHPSCKGWDDNQETLNIVVNSF